MKTNHRRNFVESRKNRHNTLIYTWRNGCGMREVEVGDSKLIGADWIGWDHSNGHRGTARAKAGAKKFIRTRLRFNENNNLRKIIRDGFVE